MMARARCTLKEADLERLLKVHVTGLGNKDHQEDDLDVVAQRYATFLAAVAAKSDRLSVSTLTRATEEVFNPGKTAAKKFAEAMAQTLRYVKASGDKATAGKKLADAVKLIYNRFQNKKRCFGEGDSVSQAPTSTVKAARVTTDETQNASLPASLRRGWQAVIELDISRRGLRRDSCERCSTQRRCALRGILQLKRLDSLPNQTADVAHA